MLLTGVKLNIVFQPSHYAVEKVSKMESIHLGPVMQKQLA
jgi:hypothetical protein